MPICAARSGRIFSLFAIVLGAFALAGCSRPVGNVSGKVTYAGKALKGGNVTFVSTEGRKSYPAGIKEDGTFSLPGITAGSYQVCVETSSLKPKAMPPQMLGAGAGKQKKEKLDADTKVPEGYQASSMADAAIANANAKNAKIYVPIPDQYAESARTPLTYTVVGGDQTYDIELK